MAPTRSALTRGFKLGSIAGVEIVADWSLGLIVLLVAVSLGGGVFPVWHPDWGTGLVWTTAMAAALLLMVSILLHELSHALVGRAQGMSVNRITLFVFGGMAELDREPHAWRVELWTALVGPIVSLALGVGMIYAGAALAGDLDLPQDNPLEMMRALDPVSTVLLWLGPINVMLAIFNLVPGFPLDGGRVLRALIWGVTGDVVRATRWAAGAGQGFGWLLMGVGFAMFFGLRLPLLGGGSFGGIWLALIGWFLAGAASTSYGRLLAQHSLRDVPVSRLMLSPVHTVTPDTPVSRLIDDYIMRSDQRAFPVLDQGRLAGLVALDDVRRVDPDKRAQRTVASIMTPADQLITISPQDNADEALQRLSRREVSQLPVVEHGEVRGLLRREELLKWLSLHGPPSGMRLA